MAFGLPNKPPMDTTQTIEKLKAMLAQNEHLSKYERLSEDEVEAVSSAVTLLQNAEKDTEKDTERVDGLRDLCGYIEAGGGESFSIGQDDATNDWVLHVGKRWWHARSFRGVIDLAIAAQQEEDSV